MNLTRFFALAGALATVVAPPAPRRLEAAPAVRIRVSPELAPCVAPLLDGFAPEAGFPVSIESGDPADPAGADVVVGDDGELRRTLEGGTADVRTAVDIGYTPSPRTRRRDPAAVVAAVVTASPRSREAHRLLDHLGSARARQAFATCSGTGPVTALGRTLALKGAAVSSAAGAARFAVGIADWWLPACSMLRNAFNDPDTVLGAPDAANLGGKDNYAGLLSLGQGGYVTVDMGQTIVNGPGPDVRVYQSTSNEPVTLYAGDAPNGPFTLVAFRRDCGTRSPGLFSNHCDFDLADASLASARYLRVEDGEIYPCRMASTVSEGADIDAVELLNP